MAAPNIKLVSSLEKLRALQLAGKVALRSTDLTRTHIERLVATGFLRPIVKGWYMPSRPEEQAGDTTTWFASMRDFVRGYCDARFGEDWHVNAELSLKLQTGTTSLPLQIQINSPAASNNNLLLPAGTSLFDYKAKDIVPEHQRTVAQNLRAMTLEAALVRVTPNVWQSDPLTLRLALQLLKDSSELNRVLLGGDHSVVAGRIAGGLRAVGRTELAVDVVATMRSAGYTVAETNPFAAPMAPVRQRPESPYCARIRAMWEHMRPQVLQAWTTPTRGLTPIDEYLVEAEERYIADAYHSLSIEGYQVSVELIEKIRNGNWQPDVNENDQRDRNALAARGYFEAHLAVRESVRTVMTGVNPGTTLKLDLQVWYRAMWAPSVQAGVLKPQDLAGWRNAAVYIKNARHVPLPPEAVRDAMPLLFELLTQENEPAVRAVLGHFVFVFIHPYMDGNGRLARFIMNLLLAEGGWPWTVVTLDIRSEYMRALDAASTDQDIKPFTRLLSSLVQQQITTGPGRPNK
jgi:Fic/DOC family